MLFTRILDRCTEPSGKQALNATAWPRKNLAGYCEKDRMDSCNTVSMFNAGDFINDTEEKISSRKRTARWARTIGFAAWLITGVLLISGAIKGCALLASHPSGDPLTTLVASFGLQAWKWMNDHLPWLWPFLWTISPYPDMTQMDLRLNLNFLLWVYGLLAISIGLRNLSNIFYREAS